MILYFFLAHNNQFYFCLYNIQLLLMTGNTKIAIIHKSHEYTLRLRFIILISSILAVDSEEKTINNISTKSKH